MFLEIRKTIADLVYPEYKIERRALERAANIDPLTGLGNRRAFELAEKTAKTDPNQWFVLFDANNFGKVNKHAGHDFGDQILKQIANSIQDAAQIFGLAERVFRLGGDEFVAIIDGKTKAETFRNLAENNFGTLVLQNINVSVSGTVGISLENADKTLQLRKRNRKQI